MYTPLQVAICEDNVQDMALLVDHIRRSDVNAECSTFSSGEEMLASFIPGRYDLMFLDIYMGGSLGVDIAVKVRQVDESVVLVFTTTSLEHTLTSYRLGALKYLEKPLAASGVQEALTLAFSQRKATACLTLLINGINQEIPLNSILYLEQKDHVVLVNTLRGTLRTSQTVKLALLESLLPDYFLRCHYSYIVNIRYIRELNRELRIFVMQDGSVVHIRRQDLKQAIATYEAFLFQAARGAEG